MDPISGFFTLIFVMDPLGNVPIFLSVLKDVSPARRRYIIARELCIALGVLLLFLYLGSAFLDVLNLRQESIRVAGAIVLFVIALRMVFPRETGASEDATQEEPLIVPLAIPLVAGPSSIAILILMVHNEPQRIFEWTAVLVAAWLVSSVILLASTLLYRVLGNRGLRAIERLMGMVLIMMAVQMFMDGFADYAEMLLRRAQSA